MQIVVARYNEDIEWTKEFQNVLIYNKGDDKSFGIPLGNVGREGHTFYKHIVDNYDNLAEHTAFLQGNPFDHSPNILKNLHNFDTNTDFHWLSEQIIYSTFTSETKWIQCKNIYETYKKVFNKIIENDDCVFGAGAQFIVSKRAILNRPKIFYENIVKLLEYSVKPDEVYDLERFHGYIFS
jgi:hypothetical protein